MLNITRRGKEFRFNHEIIVRLEDAPRVSNVGANFRSVIKSDPRVLRNMHRRVFLDSISKEGLHLVISFYIETVNKDQFYAIQQEMLQHVGIFPEAARVRPPRRGEGDGGSGWVGGG